MTAKWPWSKLKFATRERINFTDDGIVYSISVKTQYETKRNIIFDIDFHEEGDGYHSVWRGYELIYNKELDAIEDVELDEKYGDGDVNVKDLLEQVFEEVKVFKMSLKSEGKLTKPCRVAQQ